MKNITSNIIIGILLLLVTLGVLWLLTRTPDLMSQINTPKQPSVPATSPKPVNKVPLSPNTETPVVPKLEDVVVQPPASNPESEPVVPSPPAAKPIP